MKRSTKISALLPAALLLLMLFGCEKKPGDPTALSTIAPSVSSTVSSTEATFPAPTTEPFREVEVKCQTVPATLDNPDNLPVLNWVCIAPFHSAYTVRESAADSMNQALADRNIPFRVQFQVLTVQDSNDSLMMFRQPQVQELFAQADLIYAPMWDESMYTYLQPITQYVTGNAAPSLAHTVPTEYHWMMTRHEGEIYGIPGSPGIVIGNGWYLDEALVQEGLVQPEDFQGKRFWEMDDVFAELYGKNGNQPFLYMGGDFQISHSTSKILYPEWPYAFLANRFQSVTSVYAVDYYDENGPQVVNYLDTEYAKNFLSAMQRYLKAGFCNRMPSDAGVLYSCVNSDFVHLVKTPDMGTVYSIPAEELDFSYGTRGYLNGLSARPPHKEEALTMLSLLGDADFRALMYTNKNVTRGPEEETGGPYAKLHFLTLYKDIEHGSYSLISYPAEEGKTAMETFEDQIGKAFLRYPLEIFDYSSMDSVIEAVNAAARPYITKFSELTEEEYNQMLFDIEAAGGDRIQQELQRQLDQWMADNPNWRDDLLG